MNDLISGALVMGYAIAGLYFLKFWRRTHDRLFAFFSLSFWVLAVQRAALAAASTSTTEKAAEEQIAFYVLRLLAFGLILVAIWDKNLSRHRQPPP